MKLFLACALALVGMPNQTRAATGNQWDGYGMINVEDNVNFTGYGVSNAVITSVLSNCLWYCTSPKASGAPRFENVMFRNDLLSGTIKFYTGTNYWIVASNSPSISGASSNIIWLTATNSGLATNDILIHESLTGDNVNLAVLSGNATDAAGLVYTNAAQQNAVKLFSGFGSPPSAGDRIWKMCPIESWTPLAIQSLTNGLASVTNIATTNIYWPLALEPVSGRRITFSGKLGKPSLVLMTFTGSADLRVEGTYYRRRP